jgi:hypothetical protein
MPCETPPESSRRSIPESTDDWIRLFIKHLELNLADASLSLPANPSYPEIQETSIRTIFQTLLDSGTNTESILETMGQILLEQKPRSTSWNAELNQRRFELIDKEIQETISSEESIELAGLTNLMRNHVDSEENLPMKGAKELHRKLLELDNKDNPL